MAVCDLLVTEVRFKRRASHVPNLTDETGTVEQWHLNMFGSAGLASYAATLNSERSCLFLTLERRLMHKAIFLSAESTDFPINSSLCRADVRACVGWILSVRSTERNASAREVYSSILLLKVK